MKPISLLWLCLALGLGLAGCTRLSTLKATAVSYRLPEGSGPTAQIRIIAKGIVRGVPSSDCIDWRKPDSGLMVRPHGNRPNPNFRSLGMPMSAEADRLRRSDDFGANELKIPANRPFALMFSNTERPSNSDLIYSCAQSVRFTPEAGVNYQLVFIHDAQQQCLALLRKIDDQGNALSDQVKLEKADYCSADARP